MEKVQDLALSLLSSDNYSNYISLLLKMEQSKMEVNRMWDLAIEVSKTLKSLNAGFKHPHFKKCSHSARKTLIQSMIKQKLQRSMKTLRIRVMGPKTWNSLSEYFKDLASLPKFTKFVKTWH